MNPTGQNEGFRVLDDFVCDAIHSPDVPLADEQHQGQNAGSLVVEELSFDASGERPGSEEIQDLDSRKAPDRGALDGAIRTEVGRVAALVSASGDPTATLALFQKLLHAELTSVQKAADAVLEKSHADKRSESLTNTAMSEPANPPKLYPRYPGYCSFCRKSYREVGPLAEGPDEVFICYRCILLCKEIIENDCARRGVEPPA